MSANQSPRDPVPDAASANGQGFEEIVTQFEAAWQEGKRPQIGDFLPTGDPDRQSVLGELIQVDLEMRLKAGETARLEDYLGSYPEIAKDTDAMLRLIAWEFALRRERQPDLAGLEYQRRFPHLASQLPDCLPEAAFPESGAKIDTVHPDLDQPPWDREKVGVGLVAMALTLPVMAGVALMFVTSLGVALAISVAMVVVSSLLVAIDAHRLAKNDPLGRKWGSPVPLFLGMCLLWIVGFPFAFFRRRHFIGPNLAFPAILVTLFCVAGPFLKTVLLPPSPPSCTSAEVVQLLEQVIRGTPLGAKVQAIGGHREVSYDRHADRRYGQCIVHTNDGAGIPINYMVQWQDRRKGQFLIQIIP